MRRVIGLLLMAACIAGLVAWNLQPPEGDDTNLFIRSLVGALLSGGAVLAWLRLVRKPPVNRA